MLLQKCLIGCYSLVLEIVYGSCLTNEVSSTAKDEVKVAATHINGWGTETDA